MIKRFWKQVAVAEADNGFVVELDGRKLSTPSRQVLTAPTRALAEGIAAEWDAVGEAIDPALMPLTGLTNAALDRIAPDRATFIADIARYGESDLTCYRAEGPQPLVEREAEAWDPLLAWARGRYDVHFELIEGVTHRAQPDATVARLAEAVAAQDDFRLVALSKLTSVGGSLVAALALLEGAFAADPLWDALIVDERWQSEQWGKDALAEADQAGRRAEFLAAAQFLTLLA